MVRLSRRASLQLILGALRVALPSAAFAQARPPLVSHWAFDETSKAARVFADSGPAQVPMTVVGAWADLSTGSLVQGVSGTSAYTDGSGYAIIPANIAAHDLSQLTMSFYFRPSSAARHILVAVGGGAHVGDFVIEVMVNGKLRGYHVGQDGVRRFFESRSGISGSHLRVGQAHRIDLTFGPFGACIYLDGAALEDAFIPENTNGWNNTRTKRVGVLADGAFDHLRIWAEQLSADQIAALEPAQSVAVPRSSGAVNVGTLAAFKRSTINVTALPGWPAGRVPKLILQQGGRASAYIRRPWKPTLNAGTHIDFVAGWQKTTGQESIRLQLDDNTELDLNYTVGHSIPAPGSGGTTRTLDRTATQAGTTYNNWASAIAALKSNDVLVVRAPTGTWTDSDGHAIPNYVYDVTASPAPAVGASNVIIIAHPDDVAAGRRPVIWRNAGRYARYKYAAAHAWEIHADLGSGRAIYQSKVTHTAPQHFLHGSYRDQIGGWTGMYNYQTMNDTTDRSGIMHDVTYAGYSTKGNLNTFMGPSLIHNRVTNRLEVRLDGPVQQVYQNPNSGSPWPPWAWKARQPASTNAGNVEIVCTDGGDVGSWNYLLDLNNRNGWQFYNLDFIYGNSVVNINGQTTPAQFFGCNFLGGVAPDADNNGSHADFGFTASIARKSDNTTHAMDLLFDRCNLYGGYPPWGSWTEGKGNEGVYGISVRREITGWSNARAIFRFSRLLDWYHFVWTAPSGNGAPLKYHWHHCYIGQCGSDGGMVCRAGNTDFVMNRNFMPGCTPYGDSHAFTGTSLRHHSFNVDLRLHPMMCTRPAQGKWSNLNNRVSVPCFTHNFNTTHGGGSYHPDRKYYNTCIGTQSTYYNEGTSSGEGIGCNIGPDSRGNNHRSFNNIGAAYPSPRAWSGGWSSFVGVYFTTGGNNQYDYNLLFRSGGMLAPAAGSHTFIRVATGGGSNTGTNYADVAALRAGSGFEVNGIQADPQFVVTPGYASNDPYAPNGAFNFANYLLGTSSPARTGARNLNDQGFPDYDFETLTTWAGGNNAPWRGALQPDVPAHEQEVGIVGPEPPLIV